MGLQVSLALSAGVMIYVSMVEIFVKALIAFSDEWCAPPMICFFFLLLYYSQAYS